MPSKGLGEAITTDKPYISSKKEFTIKPYALGFVAEYELIRWDKYAIFGDMTRELTKSAVDRCNILAASIFNNGFSTADPVYTVYNSEALFSTSHALLGGGTISNRSSSDAALSYLALQTARTAFATLKNERGLFVGSKPQNLLVHPTKRWQADTLIQSEKVPGTANNDKNVLPSFSINDNPYLTSNDAWFLLAPK